MLDKELVEELKLIFVTRKECDSITDEINIKISNDTKELAIINAKLSIVLWLLGAVGTAVIAVLISVIFRGL